MKGCEALKKSEKDKVIKLINNCKTGDIVLGSEDYAIVNMTVLSKCIENIPTELDEITEVYAVKDCMTGDVYWNAHGCPYKYKEDAEQKIRLLMNEKKFREPRLFTLLTYKLDK